MSRNTASSRLATRLAFLIAGLLVACWAPIVPFAKENTGVDEAGLGLLLLCLGIGSVAAMPVTGWLSAVTGSRPIILVSSAGLILTLPFLALAQTPILLGLALLVFGACLGSLDVSMNVHAVEVEADAPAPLMSGFHAMFSVGGILGAGGVTLLLSLGLEPLTTTLIGSAMSIVLLIIAYPRLLPVAAGEPQKFVLPRGVVLLFAALGAITFLSEGALLDWGALFLMERNIATLENAGLGYVLFSVAMTIGRFTGDWTVARLGSFRTLLWGGLTAVAGFVVILLADTMAVSMAGFVLIGAGAANLVPVVFSLAGRQKIMPGGMAIASVTTVGYAGILLGPAVIGFVSNVTSLGFAFTVLALLMAIVPLTARAATRAV